MAEKIFAESDRLKRRKSTFLVSKAAKYRIGEIYLFETFMLQKDNLRLFHGTKYGLALRRNKLNF